MSKSPDRWQISYLEEKFGAVISSMLYSMEPLQERLASAFLYSLIYVHKDGLPKDLAGQYDEIVEALTKVAPRENEGAVLATTSRMTEGEARKWIEKILLLYDDFMEWKAVYLKEYKD